MLDSAHKGYTAEELYGRFLQEKQGSVLDAKIQTAFLLNHASTAANTAFQTAVHSAMYMCLPGSKTKGGHWGLMLCGVSVEQNPHPHVFALTGEA